MSPREGCPTYVRRGAGEGPSDEDNVGVGNPGQVDSPHGVGKSSTRVTDLPPKTFPVTSSVPNLCPLTFFEGSGPGHQEFAVSRVLVDLLTD